MSIFPTMQIFVSLSNFISENRISKFQINELFPSHLLVYYILNCIKDLRIVKIYLLLELINN